MSVVGLNVCGVLSPSGMISMINIFVLFYVFEELFTSETTLAQKLVLTSCITSLKPYHKIETIFFCFFLAKIFADSTNSMKRVSNFDSKLVI